MIDTGILLVMPLASFVIRFVIPRLDRGIQARVSIVHLVSQR